MNIEQIKQAYPEIDPVELYPRFPRLSLDGYPELSGYSWEECHAGAMGPGGLFFAADMARTMGLTKGMRVLDLGPGKGATSVFLAKQHGVQVVAADHWIEPAETWKRAVEAGVGSAVLPVRVEAHDLPFAPGCFDAIFVMDAYHYFGTSDLYLAYLLKFARPGAVLCIGGPCYAAEISENTPKEFLHDESAAYHSPGWWEQHLKKTGLVDVKQSGEHPLGREIWLDWVRWELEEKHPREREGWKLDCVLEDIVMLLSDDIRYNTHFILTVVKR